MASHDDLVLIINQLLKGLDKMGDSLSVVKAIGEEVNLIKEDVNLIKSRVEKIESRVEKIEEKICRELPTKSELLTIRDVLDTKLKPLNHISDMNERLLKMEGSISHLRNIEEKSPLKSDVNPVVDIVDCIKKSLYDSRLTALDIPSPRVRGEALRFHSEFKGENILITNDGTTASRMELSKTNAAVVTERPLGDDEIFSVRIDKSDESIDERESTTPVLGLILNPTANIRTAYNFPGKVGVWCLSWGDVHNQTFGSKTYSFRLDNIPDGTVLGVTRKKNGDVHFFKDGVDMGLAFKSVPYRVYGFFEVLHYVTQISIVNQNH